jgi:hypothetical protein
MKDLSKIFRAIRDEVDVAESRSDLTELYKRAGHFVMLTHDPTWRKQLGDDADDLRRTGDDEFRQTARQINQRASEIGAEPNFADTWEPIAQSTASGPRVTP